MLEFSDVHYNYSNENKLIDCHLVRCHGLFWVFCLGLSADRRTLHLKWYIISRLLGINYNMNERGTNRFWLFSVQLCCEWGRSIKRFSRLFSIVYVSKQLQDIHSYSTSWKTSGIFFIYDKKVFYLCTNYKIGVTKRRF